VLPPDEEPPPDDEPPLDEDDDVALVLPGDGELVDAEEATGDDGVLVDDPADELVALFAGVAEPACVSRSNSDACGEGADDRFLRAARVLLCFGARSSAMLARGRDWRPEGRDGWRLAPRVTGVSKSNSAANGSSLSAVFGSGTSLGRLVLIPEGAVAGPDVEGVVVMFGAGVDVVEAALADVADGPVETAPLEASAEGARCSC